MPTLEDLFRRRLLIQTGKGGTGKTTVSAALATLAARRGKRTLLIEVDTHDRFAPLFDHAGAIGYKIVEMRENLFALNLDPHLVIVDFFHTHIRFQTIYRQILDSKVFQYFYAAAPGLKELICLGKVWRLLGERKRGKPVWDLVVLDAPATGHGLAILNIAQAAYDTLFGPMRQHAGEIRDMLRDPATTMLNLCAIPEEMPVNEASELYQAVRERLHIPLGASFLSGTVRASLGPDEVARLQEAAKAPAARAAARLADAVGGASGLAALARAARLDAAYAEQTNVHAERLRQSVPLPIVEIPFLPRAGFDGETLLRVAEAIEAGFEAIVPVGAEGRA